MRLRSGILYPLTLAAVLAATAACGSSGSSGTGGGTAAGSSASGKACAPVAGQQLVVLQDDKHLQNADNVIPAVNSAAAQANPALLPALNAVSAKLTTDQLIKLNAAVDLQRMSADGVASQWVSSSKVTDGLQKGSGTVVVGGANFTESTILATIYVDVLKAAGFNASVQAVGNRELYLPALESGQIQVMPEYLATITDFINRALNGPSAKGLASANVQNTLAALKPLATKVGLVFGTPSDAVDQNAFAVTKALADKLKVHSLSELAKACSDASLVLGGPPECRERPYCEPGLKDRYGLRFSNFVQLDAAGPLTKAALKQAHISIGLVTSTAAELSQE